MSDLGVDLPASIQMLLQSTWFLILGGLGLLALGGDLVVRGGVGLARSLRISPLIVGVVFLGFGTSLPELVTSLQGALIGSSGVSLGNVVGSNIANLLLIAGVAGAPAAAMVSRLTVFRDGTFMLASSAALVWLMWEDRLDQTAGLALLAALAVYLAVALLTEKRPDPASLEKSASRRAAPCASRCSSSASQPRCSARAGS